MPPEPHLSVPLDPLPGSPDRNLSEAKLNFEKVVSTDLLSHVHHEEILKRGPVPEVVFDVIQKKKIDLLVLGAHGRTGLKKIVMGSVARNYSAAHRAQC